MRLSFPFTIRLSSKLARFKVDHDTIDLLTRHATMAKEHRIVVNTIRISLTPGGVEGGGRGGDFLSGNTRASSSNPRIYATLAWILRDCKDGRGGWSSEEGERGKGGDSFPMIYSTVFLTSITWPNNCRFIEDLYRWLKKND